MVAIRYFGHDKIPDNSGWLSLIPELESLGFKFSKMNEKPEASHLIVIDYVSRDEAYWPSVPKNNRFLIATEPQIVNPIQFSNRVLGKFNRVIVPSSHYPRGENINVWKGGYYLPTRNEAALVSNDGLRHGCAIVNENKFSCVRGSNYALRTEVILRALKSGVELTIAGKNWARGFLWTSAKIVHHFFIALRAKRLNVSLRSLILVLGFSLVRKDIYPQFIGTVEDSIEFLSKFKVAIVIENESSAVSEKLYAALSAGCQCVYVGPPLDPEDFPKGFLFPSKPTTIEVLRNLDLAFQTPYSIAEDSLRKYLGESNFVVQQGVNLRNSWVAKSIYHWTDLYQRN